VEGCTRFEQEIPIEQWGTPAGGTVVGWRTLMKLSSNPGFSS